MAELLRLVDRVARSESTVLILGESGTGKELMARRLHARSRRADGPFVSVSCANLPAELIESELFGHEKGAFTGALRAREGRFRAAQGGTLFLDEVAEMPLPLQTRLLRALQERVVDVLGRDQPVPVDVRVLAATNRDPREEVRQGRFREDLYFRLAVIELRVPPLRERPEDIALLARHFVDLASPERELRIPESLLQTLRTRPWPGNVRELANACERMAVLAEGDELAVGDLSVGDLFTGALSPLGQTGDTAWMEGIPEGTSLVAVEKQLIAFTLRRCGGNLSAAARRLGVPRHILVYRLEKHGIPRQG
jgi:two-component system NtrC family response regulator